jgi:hypothetical protein
MTSASDERIDYCSGTLIAHVVGGTDCTDDECSDHDRARHRLVVDCIDVAGGCGCLAGVSRRRTG